MTNDGEFIEIRLNTVAVLKDGNCFFYSLDRIWRRIPNTNDEAKLVPWIDNNVSAFD
jgi:hypothetical protein